jgi:drug/metabolite transporter (DMT)-like permease
MSIQGERRAYLELHFAVFLWGFTAILGDLIALSALTLVWWRVFLVSVSLVAFVRFGTLIPDLGWRRTLRFAGIGVLVGLHWVAFYGSIKLANASIALVCMATTSFFASLLEPLLAKRRFQWIELFLGIGVIPGMVLVVNGAPTTMSAGIWVGLAAALLATMFTIFNKIYIRDSNPIRITFLELGSACLFLSLLLPFFHDVDLPFWPTPLDWAYLLVLSLLCTTLAYILSLRALNHLSAFAASLTVNLEPVYGIALAYFLLRDGQELTPSFYWGVVVVIIAVFAYPLLRRWIVKP